MKELAGSSSRSLVLLSLIAALSSLPCCLLTAEDSATAPTSILSVQWAKGVPEGIGSSNFASVARESTGNTYAVGYMQDETLGLGDGVSVTGRQGVNFNPLLVKYGPTGRVLWARSATGGEAQADFTSVALDAAGNAYAVGKMQRGFISFGSGAQIENKGLLSSFLIVKFDPSGKPLWLRSMVSTPGDSEHGSEFYSVAVDKKGSVFAAGRYQTDVYGKVEPESKAPGFFSTPSPNGQSGGLLVKYDPSGRALWAALPDANEFSNVAVDTNGDVVAVIRIILDSDTYIGNDVSIKIDSRATSAVVVKYASSGKVLWASYPARGDRDLRIATLGLDAKGGVYVCGELVEQGLFNFGNGVTVKGSSPTKSPLVVKYDARGKAQWARSLPIGDGEFNFHASALDDRAVYLQGSVEIKKDIEVYGLLASYDLSGAPGQVEMPLTAPGLSQSLIDTMCDAGSGSLVIAGQIGSIDKDTVDFGNGLSVERVGRSRYSLFIARYKLLPVSSSVGTSPSSPSVKAQEPSTRQGPASSQSVISNDDRVRVRAAPNLQAATLGYLSKGDVLTVLEKSATKMRIDTMEDYWYRVRRISDGLEGWSFGQYLKLEQ